MKMKKLVAGTVLLLSLLSLTGCGRKTESWAYNHEPTQEVLALYSNGKATYKGDEYKYKRDDSYIYLKTKDDSTQLHYVKDGDNIILYEKSVYHRSGSDGDGVVGLWTQDNGWSYQFTEEGKFSEDNIFYGSYSVDEEQKCIKLMYDDPLQDAYLYYELEGDELTIDYPWPMVPTQKEGE
nr:hypothetical protein [uncultured Butyrivibrio sp.]